MRAEKSFSAGLLIFLVLAEAEQGRLLFVGRVCHKHIDNPLQKLTAFRFPPWHWLSAGRDVIGACACWARSAVIRCDTSRDRQGSSVKKLRY